MGSVPVKADAITLEKHESFEGDLSSDIDTLQPENTAKEGRGSLTADSSDTKTSQVATVAEQQEWEYITGPKLFLVIGTVTLACFIMLLDTSIVATVGRAINIHSYPPANWQGYS
jgi:hypothetical protein